MTENKLFQLAQVISDISPRHSPTLPLINQRQDRRSLPLRKNYSENCTCEELQPRRGKNLPAGGLDSRAKKLNRNDIDDYEFTINWLQENAHPIYRDASNQVIGLTNQTEVGLCKAHSSTLYRAKKRREKDTPMPPSPPDLLTDTPMENTNNPTHHPSHHHKIIGGLAAKVKELQESSSSSSSLPPPLPPPSLPDITMIPSTSYKRKRTNNDHPDLDINLPHSSASTPLYSSSSSLMSSPPPSSSSSSSQHHHHHLHHPHPHHHHPHAHHHTTSISSPPPHFISSQLPPLQPPQQQQQPISASLSSLSSSLQHQLQLSSKYNPYPSPINSTSSVPPPPLPTSSTSSTSSNNNNNNNNSRYMSQQHTYHHHHHQQQQSPGSQSQPSPTSSLPPMQPFIQIETVSLKSKPTSSSSSTSSNNTIDDDDNNNDSTTTTTYFIKNLAITDTFTFRQLLDEIDITSPPPGKRIVISDPQSDRVFPLSQPIRSVLPRPTSSHMEFYLGLTDKTSIDWKC
ncbi:unnamed protein product [Cunninghamella echinulata]